MSRDFMKGGGGIRTMVTRSDKSSTKLRIVYNTIAKGKNGVGLNDCLYKGRYVSPVLYEILSTLNSSHHRY